MNWKTWVPLVLAAVLGLVAAKAGRDIIVRAQHAGVAKGKFTSIVAAKADLEPGHALTESDLMLVATQSEAVPRIAFRQASNIAGRTLLVPVVKGQAILESFLAPTGSGAGPQALVPPGMRAVTIDVNEASGLAGLLTPGCSIDVVTTLQDGSAGQQVARTIVQNARVLAVGARLMAPARKDGEEITRAKTITLLVSPRDAEAIELACNAGRTRLVLRGALDGESANTAGITIAQLLGEEHKKPVVPAHVALPTTQPVTPMRTAAADMPRLDPSRSVEVIRNGVATHVQVPAGLSPVPSAVTGVGSEVAPAFPGRSP